MMSDGLMGTLSLHLKFLMRSGVNLAAPDGVHSGTNCCSTEPMMLACWARTSVLSVMTVDMYCVDSVWPNRPRRISRRLESTYLPNSLFSSCVSMVESPL